MDPAELLRTSPHAVVVADADGAVVYANDAATRMLGTRPTALLPLLVGDAQEAAAALLREAAAGRTPAPVSSRLAGEPERWVHLAAAPGPDGAVQLALRDVTQEQAWLRRLELREQHFRAAFDSSPTGMALLDDRGAFVEVNQALVRTLGYPRAWFEGRAAVELVHPDEMELHREMVRRVRQGQGGQRQARRYLRSDGSLRHVLMAASPVGLGDRGALTLLQLEDVTERHHAEGRLRHLALHDALTDLPGRSLVLDRLRQALEVLDGGLVAVLFVDLDGFKLVNDALGHAAGDAVLVQAGERLREVVRRGDTVGRFGGDEFLVVCPGLADHQEGLEVAGRVERALAEPYPYEGDEVLVTASVGVAFTGDRARTEAVELVNDADTAMYRAKEMGKRRYEVFDSAMRERAAERVRLARLLSQRAEDGEVVVHYQPVVDLTGRHVVGVEALMRIRDEDGTLLLPAQFLELAQDSAVLPQLDEVLLGAATAQVQRWRESLDVDLELAVNASAGWIGPDLPGSVERALTASGLPAERLVLELTEQTLIGSGPRVVDVLAALRRRGVRFALDDFGTGWGSLTYLRRFPIDVVKVDRSFVAGLPQDPDDLAIVRAVVELAHQLGMRCTAEGIETEDQHAALTGLSPEQGQGWLYARALPPEELPAALERLGARRLG